MKFLIVGCGAIGKRHMRNLNSINAGELIAYRTGKSGSDEIEKEFNAKVFYDLNNALRQKPNCALITNPTSLHIQTALKIAKAGVHLFIEKPLSHNAKGVKELVDVVKKKKLACMVGYEMRFIPSLIKIRELVQGGAVGKVLSARIQVGSNLPDWRPGKDYSKVYSARKELGGGVILDLSHEIDYARWFFGEAKEVFCYAGKLSNLKINVEDTAEILVKFRSGAIGEIHMDYVQKPGGRSVRIVGEKGTISWELNKKKVRLFSMPENKWTEFSEQKNYNINEAYIEEMKHFISCMNGTKKPLIDLEDAGKTLELALAAKKSAQTGKAVKLGGGKL